MFLAENGNLSCFLIKDNLLQSKSEECFNEKSGSVVRIQSNEISYFIVMSMQLSKDYSYYYNGQNTEKRIQKRKKIEQQWEKLLFFK